MHTNKLATRALRRSVNILVLAICLVPSLAAQSSNAATTAADRARLATHRSTMDTAAAHAKGNNLANAEAAVVQLNRGKPNTAGWHIESAQRLLQIADRLAREGQPTNTTRLANSALQHLAKAEGLPMDPRTRASAKTLKGFIHERYLGESTAALAEYSAAAELSPNATRAKAAANRLTHSGQKTSALPAGR